MFNLNLKWWRSNWTGSLKLFWFLHKSRNAVRNAILTPKRIQFFNDFNFRQCPVYIRSLHFIVILRFISRKSLKAINYNRLANELILSWEMISFEWVFKIWIFDAVLYTVCIYMFEVFIQLLITANNFLRKTFWATSVQITYIEIKTWQLREPKAAFRVVPKCKEDFCFEIFFGKILNWSVLECPLLKIYSRNFGIHQNGLNQNDVKGNI